MLVLALDTTTRSGSCAVARDGVVLRQGSSDSSMSQAARLPLDLMALLDEAGVTLADIDVYAVAVGPGSFTGMRVGIATMQGLAFAGARPLIGVSTLDALAHAATPAAGQTVGTRVAAWVDAWRGEVYAALYQDGVEAAPAVVAHPELLLSQLATRSDDAASAISGTGAALVFVGDGALAHRALITERLGPRAVFVEPLAPALAGEIAMLATASVRAGACPPPHAIRPLYVRRSDVELARDARAAQ